MSTALRLACGQACLRSSVAFLCRKRCLRSNYVSAEPVSRYILSDQLRAACLWLGWLRSIDLGFDKCRETLGVILGAGTGVSWPCSHIAVTMPITTATIRRSVDMYAVHWFQRLLVVMRHGESTGVARSQQSKLWPKHVYILGPQVDHDRSPRLAPRI